MKLNKSEQVIKQKVLPTSLRKTAFSLLHQTVTAGHLGQKRPLVKLGRGFIGFIIKKTLNIGAKYVIFVHQENSHIEKLRHR